jgi:hypothetical protein
MRQSHRATGKNNYALLVDDLVRLARNGDLQQSVAKSCKILKAYELTVSSSKPEAMKVEGSYMKRSKFISQ